MSNILKLTLICSLIFHVLMGKAAGVGELKQIKENYRQMLIPSSIEQDSLLSDLIKIKPEKEMSDQAVVELHQLYPFDLKKIDGYLSLMSADGSWTDINYADTPCGTNIGTVETVLFKNYRVLSFGKGKRGNSFSFEILV